MGGREESAHCGWVASPALKCRSREENTAVLRCPPSWEQLPPSSGRASREPRVLHGHPAQGRRWGARVVLRVRPVQIPRPAETRENRGGRLLLRERASSAAHVSPLAGDESDGAPSNSIVRQRHRSGVIIFLLRRNLVGTCLLTRICMD